MEVSDFNRKYSRDLTQGGFKIPCVITLQGNKELVYIATREKLLVVSIKGIKPTDEQNCENPEKNQVLVLSATRPGPKSKMDQIKTD